MQPKVIKADFVLVKPDEMPYSVVQMKRMYGCDAELIATQEPGTSRRDVLDEMAKATEAAGFTLKDRRIIRFGIGEGVTVAQLLAESLSDMHTYPEFENCAHVWIDYCCFNRDNTDLGEKWWELTTALLKPRLVVDYPTIYVPVRMSTPEYREYLLAA